MTERRDSTVIVFDGPRGAGKTLSAVAECIIRMVGYGETIISNVPIKFTWSYEDGTTELFESKPLNVQSLLEMKSEYTNATIFWDEMSLWLYSRTAGAGINRLSTLVFTLLRKRQLSLIITTQFVKMIDSNVRLQMDMQVSCMDLSYRYPHLQRGSVISQKLQDVSGKYSGHSIYDDGETDSAIRHQLFYGKVFWGTYDTYQEFDVLEAQGKKYRVDYGTTMLGRGEVDGAFVPGGAPDRQRLVRLALDGLPEAYYRADDLFPYLNSAGIDGHPNTLGDLIQKAGWVKQRTRNGTLYHQPNSEFAQNRKNNG